jgi:hypothetical protein
MLHVGVDLSTRLAGHMYDGKLRFGGLLDGPLLSYEPPEPPLDPDESIPIYSVLGINKLLNPAFKVFMTMLEMDNWNGVPVIGSKAVQRIIGNFATTNIAKQTKAAQPCVYRLPVLHTSCSPIACGME